MKQLNVRLPDSDWEEVSRARSRLNVSMAAFVREALKRYEPEQEVGRIDRLEERVARLEQIAEGRYE